VEGEGGGDRQHCCKGQGAVIAGPPVTQPAPVNSNLQTSQECHAMWRGLGRCEYTISHMYSYLGSQAWGRAARGGLGVVASTAARLRGPPVAQSAFE
jgi:hypothetical protein